MDKALLDYEVSIDADCKTLTVGKPFAIEGNLWELIIFAHLGHKMIFNIYLGEFHLSGFVD